MEAGQHAVDRPAIATAAVAGAAVAQVCRQQN